MNSPIPYYGGKTGLARRIVSLFPPHQVYIEPFFGSGAVFFHKPPSRFEILNDLDDRIVTFFKVLRERPDELAGACFLSPHSRTEWETSATVAGDEDLEIARKLFVRVNQSFAKTLGTSTGWSITTARTQSIPGSIRSRLGRFAAAAARLQSATIENCAAVELIERFGNDESAVIYCDPPYLASTRRGGRGTRASDYAHDTSQPADHESLAAALHQVPAFVVLSGYHSPLYDDLYAEWEVIEIPVTVHSSNARTNSRNGRLEVLWTNKPSRHQQSALFA